MKLRECLGFDSSAKSKEEEEGSREEKELQEYIVSVVKGMSDKDNKPKPTRSTTLKAIAKRLSSKKSDDDKEE